MLEVQNMNGFYSSPRKLSTRNTFSKSPLGSPTRSPMKSKAGTPDRFIPKREAGDVALKHYLLTNNEDNASNVSPAQKAYNDSVARSVLNHDASSPARILSFQSPKKRQREVESYEQTLRCLHRKKAFPTNVSLASRSLPKSPEMILDCPDIVDDYYLNLLDWSNDNVVAIALNSAVYLWNGTTMETSLLVDHEEEIVTSLAWHKGRIHG